MSGRSLSENSLSERATAKTGAVALSADLSASTRQGISAAVIQDFEISINSVGGEQYSIRTGRVAKGVPKAEELVKWPVAQWLERTQAFMHDPLIGLLQQQRHTRASRNQGSNHRKGKVSAAAGNSAARQADVHAAQSRLSNSVNSESAYAQGSSESATLVHLGRALYDSLFQGQLRESWVTAQGIAQNRQTLLRLRIGMKDSRLQQLPWEVLHEGARPLATGTDVIFSRYILDRWQGHLHQIDTRKESDKTIKILVVIASPNDQERLELKQEVEHLRSELHPLIVSGEDKEALDIQLTLLEQPGRAELTQALDGGDYKVLHYAGHSDLGNAGGDLYLVSRQTGLTERLSGEDLAGLLVNNGIQLAVFNSCRGGYSSSGEQGWQERNLAQALINRGLPSVIAMAERIPDDVAIAFTQLLYRNLKKGLSVDLSLNRTRQGLISVYGSHQFYWALPTLYMQPSFNGYLLDRDGDHEWVERLDQIDNSMAEPALKLPAIHEQQPIAATGLAQSPVTQSPVTQSPVAHRSISQSSSQSSVRSSDAQGSGAQVLSTQGATAQRSRYTDTVNTTNHKKLVNNNDVALTDSVVQKIGAPSTATSAATDIDVDIDGELRVPEDIKTPRGFYGEPAVSSKPAPPVNESPGEASPNMSSDMSGEPPKPLGSVSRSPQPRPADANIPPEQLVLVDNEAPQTHSDTPAESLQTSEELIGERLTRSHTLHTKILTVPGMASIAAALLLGVMTVTFLQRPKQPDPARSADRSELTQDELGLPAQVEVALLQDNIDAAIAPAKALIEQGDYKAAIAALDTASTRQQQDVIVSFFKGRAQWGLVKQGSSDFAADDARRSWKEALASEPDWMEISMALGFAQYAIGREQEALESWEQAIALAERQSDAQITYFSEQSKEDYMLSAYAGLAMVSLSLSKIEANPDERNALLDQAVDAYQTVMNEAPADFSARELGQNWLWLGSAIADWNNTKKELSQLIE